MLHVTAIQICGDIVRGIRILPDGTRLRFSTSLQNWRWLVHGPESSNVHFA